MKKGNCLMIPSIFRMVVLIVPMVLFGCPDAIAQGFTDRLKLGFGGGVNLAIPLSREDFSVYEDLSGEALGVNYRGRMGSPGSQYFFQADYSVYPLILSIKPGTYSYNFYRSSTILFETEVIEQENQYLLRYFSIPLEAKYSPLESRVKPYAGGGVSYGFLLRSMGVENQAFNSSRITASLIAGIYYEAGFYHLNLQAGYSKGLHLINNKDQRFQTGLSDSYALADLVLDDFSISFSVLFSLEKSRFASNRQCKYPLR